MDRLARLARLRAVERRDAGLVARDLALDAARADAMVHRLGSLIDGVVEPGPRTETAANLAVRAVQRATLGQAHAAATARADHAHRRSADASHVNRLARARVQTVERLQIERTRAADARAQARMGEDPPSLARGLQTIGPKSFGA